MTTKRIEYHTQGDSFPHWIVIECDEAKPKNDNKFGDLIALKIGNHNFTLRVSGIITKIEDV